MNLRLNHWVPPVANASANWRPARARDTAPLAASVPSLPVHLQSWRTGEIQTVNTESNRCNYPQTGDKRHEEGAGKARRHVGFLRQKSSFQASKRARWCGAGRAQHGRSRIARAQRHLGRLSVLASHGQDISHDSWLWIVLSTMDRLPALSYIGCYWHGASCRAAFGKWAGYGRRPPGGCNRQASAARSALRNGRNAPARELSVKLGVAFFLAFVTALPID